MVRAGAFDDLIGRGLAIVRGGPFLQRAFGVLRRGEHAAGAVAPRGADRAARAVEPGFEIKRTDQRFHHIAQHIVRIRRTIVARLLAEAEMRGDAEPARDIGADGARHECVEPLRQCAFGFLREQFEQPLRHHQAEHAVTQKFQSFVIRRRLAAMRQRAFVSEHVGGPMPQRRGQPVAQGLAQNPSPIRSQRAAENHVHGRNQFAEPSVEKNDTIARPSIRSIGT